MNITQKKGIALNQAFGAVLTLILIGVVVIIGIVIFVSLRASFTNLATNNPTDETVSMDSGIGTVTNATLCNFGGFSVITATNGTGAGGVIISPGGNYTVNSADGTITNLSDVMSEDWLVNSTSNWGGPACTSSNAMITQFATYPALVGLIGTIIFLGIVIGVLVISFAFGGRRA